MALLAAFGYLSLPVQAQVGGTYPSPVGAARMPQPIPTDPSTAPPPYDPNLVPGPISPLAAPMGPPDALSLPYDHTSAFQTENYVQENGVYLNIGPMALQRNHLGAGDIAVINAASQGKGPPSFPNPFAPAQAGTTDALQFNDISPALSMGIRGTVGYLWHDQAIEFTSFYIWQNNVSAAANQPGALDTLFYNPPLTFLGQGLFRLTDTVQLTQGSNLFNAEVNYRRWNSAFANGFDLIFGARYIGQNDYLAILSQGTAPILNSFGLPPGRDAAVYQVMCHNNIVAPQLGAEYNLRVFNWLTLSGMGKGAWGVNYLTSDVSLTRQDGLVGFNSLRHATVFGQIYELGAFADINILEKLRLRLGYTATSLLGVATAVDQVGFNMRGAAARQGFGLAGVESALQSGNMNTINNAQAPIQHGNVNNNGSLLYFGPQIELQFFF